MGEVGVPSAKWANRAVAPARVARAVAARAYTRLSETSAIYLVPMFLIVAFAAGLVLDAFLRSALPPGVDPGHWLAISYTYAGLPTAPDPTNRLLFYSPLMFPFLGALVRLTGSPPLAADLLASGLIAAFGLSTAWLGRRYLASGPLQVALVGLVVLSGTTMQMVTWGGYPNLLGFVFINVAMIFLLRFVRTKSDADGAWFFTAAALTYLAHDLSFAILVAVVGVAFVYLLALRKLSLRILLHRAVVLGLVGLGLTVFAYTRAAAYLGASGPNYLTANPPAHFIDEVGELFAPLAHAPMFFAPGPAVFLPAVPTAVALALAPLVGLLGIVALGRLTPGRVDSRLALGTAWLAAALAVPGVGYLAHVDTDYTRFLYFLPLPFVLVVLLATERLALPYLVPEVAAKESPPPAPPPPSPWVWPGETPPPPPPPGYVVPRYRRPLRRPQPSNGPAIAGAVVALMLIALAGFVTVPTLFNGTDAATNSAHDAPFVQAMQWLKAYPAPGNVLTVSGAARWAEALSLRDASTVGPVWLLFDPFQITDTQEAYWALTSDYTVTNRETALSYSGFATPVLSAAPMYTAYVEGVPFPVLRVLPGSLAFNATGPNGTQMYPAAGTGAPAIVPVGANATSITVVYQSFVATLGETGTVLPDGSSVLTFVVTPHPGATVHALSVLLAPPTSGPPTLGTDQATNVSLRGTALEWDVQGKLGQYPDPVTVPSTATFSEAPTSGPAPPGLPDSVPLAFADPNGTGPFTVTVHLRSGAPANPSAQLPSLVSTSAFLAAHDIHFLLWPNSKYPPITTAYYEATFGYRVVYSNPEWQVLQG